MAEGNGTKSPRYEIAHRLDGFDRPTVWHEFTPLASVHGAVNLGQGFPDWEAPEFVTKAMVDAVKSGQNQYCRSGGHPALVQALAKRYATYLARPIDWQSEVTIGVGATESIFSIMQAFVNEGDEVVLLEPAFDIYRKQAMMAGGVCKFVPLRLTDVEPDAQEAKHIRRQQHHLRAAALDGGAAATAGAEAEEEEEEEEEEEAVAAAAGVDDVPATIRKWVLNMDELRAALTHKTRILVLNTPHNPTGKVFSLAELEQIAAIVRNFPRLVVVCDEVYEHIVHDGRKHQRLAALPGMWDQCLTVSSAGKTFSVTGWKIGWTVGPAPLIRAIMLTNAWVQFSISTPAQVAVAAALDEAEKPYRGSPTFYSWLRKLYRGKRSALVHALRASGLRPVVPEGGFFVMAETTGDELRPPASYMRHTTAAAPAMTRDWALCRFLTMECKVAAIPPTAFYCDANKAEGEQLIRFACCKQDDSLAAATERLAGLRSKLADARAADQENGVTYPDPAPPAAQQPVKLSVDLLPTCRSALRVGAVLALGFVVGWAARRSWHLRLRR